jgi:hypothetical protein
MDVIETFRFSSRTGPEGTHRRCVSGSKRIPSSRDLRTVKMTIMKLRFLILLSKKDLDSVGTKISSFKQARNISIMK